MWYELGLLVQYFLVFFSCLSFDMHDLVSTMAIVVGRHPTKDSKALEQPTYKHQLGITNGDKCYCKAHHNDVRSTQQ